MFAGHFGIALAGKRVAPAASLGTLFAAAQFADLLWPNLVLLGIERVEIAPGATAVTPLDFIEYPYSHSLLALVLWGSAAAVLYRFRFRTRSAEAITIALLVVSHWILDAVTHRPDMPLWIGDGPRLGLGLWNSVPGTLIVETALLAAGVAFYIGRTRARDRIGVVALWCLIAFLVVVTVANLLGPPPPSAAAVAWTAQSMWVLVAWGHWIDRHRSRR